MSLSQEPAYSVLKNELVCGYKDISNEAYAGFSGKHELGTNAINTTNGAGPHNLQTFLLASDGTVLHCLPGYWAPIDLVREVEFAARLHDLWFDPSISTREKKSMFSSMQLAHVREHPFHMVARSRMQGFDMKHEAKYRLHTSDTILDRNAAAGLLVADAKAKVTGKRPTRPWARGAFKTTDRIMHERMAKRPFVAYSSFDVAKFADYGRPLYDKNEKFRNEQGHFVANGRRVDRPPVEARQQELLGKVPDFIQRRRDRRMGRQLPRGDDRHRSIVNNSGWGSPRETPASVYWGANNRPAARQVLWGAR